MCGYEQGEAKKFAHRAALTFALWFGVAAVVLAVGAAPAEADKKRNPAKKSGEESIPDPANGEPLTLVIALNEQTIDIYRGTSLIKSSKVSSGTRGYATMAGVFTILEKRRHHHSNMYSGAPMPWMQASHLVGDGASWRRAPRLSGISWLCPGVIFFRPEIVPHHQCRRTRGYWESQDHANLNHASNLVPAASANSANRNF